MTLFSDLSTFYPFTHFHDPHKASVHFGYYMTFTQTQITKCVHEAINGQFAMNPPRFQRLNYSEFADTVASFVPLLNAY